MRKYLTLLSILLCSFLVLSSQTATAQDSILISQIKEIEGKLPDIVEKNDVESLDRLLHPGFTVQSTEGNVVVKTQLLTSFRKGQNPYLKFRPIANSVVIVDSKTVITSGNEIYAHKSEHESVHEKSRFFYHVWIKYNNLWLLAGRIIATLPEKKSD